VAGLLDPQPVVLAIERELDGGERARMDQMTKELSFGNFSGMTDATQVATFGKMAGASILVTGSLLKADTETKGFTGFGISTGQAQTTATIRVRAYDVEKGTVVYSSTATGSTSSFKTSFGGAGKTDQASELWWRWQDGPGFRSDRRRDEESRQG
jgi:curli biogenesis system outer membrane secretion channel CsgG